MCGRRVGTTGEPPDRTRGRERQREHGAHAQQHENQVAQLELPGVLALGAQQVADRRKLDLLSRAPAQQMKHERHGRRAGQHQGEGCEKTHGRCWRAANARRSATPNGWSV